MYTSCVCVYIYIHMLLTYDTVICYSNYIIAYGTTEREPSGPVSLIVYSQKIQGYAQTRVRRHNATSHVCPAPFLNLVLSTVQVIV